MEFIYHNLDLVRVSELKNARIHNVTTAERATLGSSLGGSNIGLVVFDTNEEVPYFWGDQGWVSVGATINGAMVLRGVVAFDSVEPVAPEVGDFYVFNTAGTNTWEGSTVVEIGDSVVWDGTTWQFIQTNITNASETTAGVIEIATQTEVNTGTDTNRAVTPATLSGYLDNQAVARTYFASGLSLTANTPLTVNHNLGLQNRNAFTISVFNTTNEAVSVKVTSTNTNSLTLTSSVALAGVSVTIIGF